MFECHGDDTRITEDVSVLINSKEKRAFRRMIINAPVTLLQGGQQYVGICQDLSANGMAISVSQHQLDIHQPLRVSLATCNNLLPPFEARARVIRTLEGKKGQLLALEFVPQG